MKGTQKNVAPGKLGTKYWAKKGEQNNFPFLFKAIFNFKIIFLNKFIFIFHFNIEGFLPF